MLFCVGGFLVVAYDVEIFFSAAPHESLTVGRHFRNFHKLYPALRDGGRQYILKLAETN